MPKKTNILVVDDEKDMCDALRDGLKDKGYSVEATTIGRDALKKIRKEDYDLVIADIKMPGVDGIKILKFVKNSKPQIGVVLISGYSDLGSAIDATRFGATDYITKPFDITELYFVVRKAIQKQKLIMKDKHLLRMARMNARKLRTHKKRLEQRLRHADKMAALGRMSAGIAHEINNPVCIIYGQAQYLKDKVMSLKASGKEIKYCEEILDMIEKESGRCKDLINNLLHFSRKEELAISLTDVNKVLNETLVFFRHPLSTQNIKLIKKLNSRLPFIMGERSSLKQVFMNIILNSQQAMPKGGKLTVMTKRSGRYVVIEINNAGPVIPKQELKNIFDPFYTKKEVGKGIGLGLSVSYSIIKGHHGRIEVDSQKDRGTTFTIKLPIRKRK